MNVTLKTKPQTEPVTLDEAKTYLNVVDHTDDDVYITSLIPAARSSVENMTGRILIDTVFTQSHRNWDPWIDLLRGNAHSIGSVVYSPAGGGAAVTVDSSLYQIERYGDGHAQVVFYDEFSEPDLIDRPSVSRIWIEFTAGYGTSAAAVPEPLKMAVLYMIAHYYENRAPVSMNVTPHVVPLSVQSICNHYKIYN